MPGELLKAFSVRPGHCFRFGGASPPWIFGNQIWQSNGWHGEDSD
jgi:hypothetical protein